jgi:hypothetical protein
VHRQDNTTDMLRRPCSACCQHAAPACRAQAPTAFSSRATQLVQPHRQRRRHGFMHLRWDPAGCVLRRHTQLQAIMVQSITMLCLDAASIPCAWHGAAAQPRQPMGWTLGSLVAAAAAGAVATAAATASHRRSNRQQQRESASPGWCPCRQCCAPAVPADVPGRMMQANTGAD